MRKRIFRNIYAVALASLVLFGACVVLLMHRITTEDGYRSLASDAINISAGMQVGGVEYLTSIEGYQGRITLIDKDGTVLYDDRQNVAVMDNHAKRPEVAAAFADGTGQAERKSDTLEERTLYYALRLEDGTVLRLGIQSDSLWAEVGRFLPWLVGIAVLLIIAAALVARRQTQWIMAPINRLDLDEPFEVDAYEELSPLLRKLALQKQQINDQVTELDQQRDEFDSITNSMDEGLLVVDNAGRVLTINQSARRILGTKRPQTAPALLLEISRNLVLEEAAKQAMAGHRVEKILEMQGRQYRVLASPSQNAGALGAVLLLMDDTEKLQAEQTRREFSANVSHELKTPLTSISGYAEILRNGLVKEEDITAFAGKIYEESARLIALVNDIIKLSHLDEKQVPAQFEKVALLPLAKETANTLEKAATLKGVTVTVAGEDITLSGVQSVLLEILYNLIDNAICYSDPGGQVEVSVGTQGGEAFIRVADTGIGIPAAHQSRVFERFYRVDKSHSRESGGTGLGLSIVKRGALFHGGRVDLVSTAGKGSIFTVWLPQG